MILNKLVPNNLEKQEVDALASVKNFRSKTKPSFSQMHLVCTLLPNKMMHFNEILYIPYRDRRLKKTDHDRTPTAVRRKTFLYTSWHLTSAYSSLYSGVAGLRVRTESSGDEV